MPILSFRIFYIGQALAVAQARSFRGAGRYRNLIIGGDEAEEDRFPYMVSLQDESTHYCGASLIAPDVVLTAGKSIFSLLSTRHIRRPNIMSQLCQSSL